MSGYGSQKDADRTQFVGGINEEAPPGVLKQLARCNITVYCVTAGISLPLKKNPEYRFGCLNLNKKNVFISPV